MTCFWSCCFTFLRCDCALAFSPFATAHLGECHLGTSGGNVGPAAVGSSSAVRACVFLLSFICSAAVGIAWMLIEYVASLNCNKFRWRMPLGQDWMPRFGVCSSRSCSRLLVERNFAADWTAERATCSRGNAVSLCVPLFCGFTACSFARKTGLRCHIPCWCLCVGQVFAV